MRPSAWMIAPIMVALTMGCASQSTVVTEPPGLTLTLNGVEQGVSPCHIESTGTTFGAYLLELRDETGAVVCRQDLPKRLRVWGIFWPPYGVFYNLFELFPGYRIRRLALEGGGVSWSVEPLEHPPAAR